MKRVITIGAFILGSFSLFSQVGVNTTDPQETLHINGTLRIEKTDSSPAVSLFGGDANGTINEVIVGNNLNLTAGTLNAANGSDSYGITSESFTTSAPNTEFDNVDLGLSGTNSGEVVIRLTGPNDSYFFTGLKGGVDGRHVVLLNYTSQNFGVRDDSSSSEPENRILTLGSSSENTSGTGAIELVYDGTLQRWIVLNIRN
jgi:hypothetical protein